MIVLVPETIKAETARGNRRPARHRCRPRLLRRGRPSARRFARSRSAVSAGWRGQRFSQLVADAPRLRWLHTASAGSGPCPHPGGPRSGRVRRAGALRFRPRLRPRHLGVGAHGDARRGAPSPGAAGATSATASVARRERPAGALRRDRRHRRLSGRLGEPIARARQRVRDARSRSCARTPQPVDGGRRGADRPGTALDTLIAAKATIRGPRRRPDRRNPASHRRGSSSPG